MDCKSRGYKDEKLETNVNELQMGAKINKTYLWLFVLLQPLAGCCSL